MTGLVLVGLVVWGTLVGLDLVSVPQAMIARPLVAGTVAGWIAGDLEAGLRLGALLELFALDVLPVGAVRYPDYGPGTVAATALVVHREWTGGLGLAVALALVSALAGGWSLRWLRIRNAGALQRARDALDRGDALVVRRLQRAAVARDALRSAVLTAGTLAAALAVARWVQLPPGTGRVLTVAAIGAGLAAAAGGAVRSAGRGRRLRWLAASGVAGVLVASLL